MWFERDTTPEKLPEMLNDVLSKALDENGQPMWRLVSTANIGTSLDDDGYVFHSKGSSGKDNLYVGLKNAYESGESSWHLGHRFFITDQYTANPTPGFRGSFGDTVTEAFRYFENSTTANVTKENYYLRCGITVNKDRIIISIRNGFSGSSRMRNLLYMGMIKRYSQEVDSSAMTIVSLYPKSTSANDNNLPSSVKMLRDGARRVGGKYNVLNRFHQPFNGQRGYGKRFITYPILLSTSMEGVRGELDGLLQVLYASEATPQKPSVPLEGEVIIDGQKYLCLVRLYDSSFGWDNLAPFSNTPANTNTPNFSYAYFIPKV